jgi:hypothetical protein
VVSALPRLVRLSIRLGMNCVTGRRDRRGAVGLERMLASL